MSERMPQSKRLLRRGRHQNRITGAKYASAREVARHHTAYPNFCGEVYPDSKIPYACDRGWGHETKHRINTPAGYRWW